jgi:hypothetical protein
MGCKSAMSKLFKLKEWLTVSDAAKRLSVTIGEEVAVADLLRLALDGHLRLSVNFVNYAKARSGTIGVPGKARYLDVPLDMKAAMRAKSPEEYQGGYTTIRMGIPLNNGDVIDMDDDVVTLCGVYDLPMIGGERLDVEQEFQVLTGGPTLTLETLEGAFVKSGELYLQLQEDEEDNEHVIGSRASLGKLKAYIFEKNLNAIKAASLMEEYQADREKFLENRKLKKTKEHYYPAGGLPNDSALVVRTDALLQFEEALKDEPKNVDKPLTTRERNTLLSIIGVL